MTDASIFLVTFSLIFPFLPFNHSVVIISNSEFVKLKEARLCCSHEITKKLRNTNAHYHQLWFVDDKHIYEARFYLTFHQKKRLILQDTEECLKPYTTFI